jgi:uncharacterized protein (TIGR04255 family)
MKLKPVPRVVYERNPLVEVVCQIRFERILELQTVPPAQFQSEFTRDSYPRTHEERAAALQVVFGKGADQVNKLSDVQAAAIPVTYHFVSPDDTKRLSVNAEFFAFTCTRYEHWEQFKQALLEAFAGFQRCYPKLAVTRVGLRYRDLIEREDLGLADVPWRDLLSPSVAGLFLGDLFADAAEDAGGLEQGTQAMVMLDDCAMLLQTALLRSNEEKPREAFLIDADFFHESPRFDVKADSIDGALEVLHGNAGALFRNCIREPLHDALRPGVPRQL